MTTVNAATAATKADPKVATKTAQSASEKFSEDYNTFLKMLTTQLQNQDPLQPMDTKDFTQQLVQYSSVEQSIRANDKLEKILSSQQSNAAMSALGYLGREVDLNGDQVQLKNGKAGFQYINDRESTRVSIQLIDKLGRTVRTMEGPAAKGMQTVEWNGRNDTGTALPDGYYTVKVTGYDSANNPTERSTLMSGRVTAVGQEDGQTLLTVNGLPIKADKVIAIREATTTR